MNFIQIIVLQLNVEFILHVENHFQKLHWIELHIFHQVYPINGLAKVNEEVFLENLFDSGGDKILHLNFGLVILSKLLRSCLLHALT
jgi:hypothetical protein